MAKRIITDLTLTHIAAVDKPCQEEATTRLIKRRPDETVPVAKAAPARSLDEAVEKIMVRDSCTRLAALDKVARECPELVSGARDVPVGKAHSHFELSDDLTSPTRKTARAKFDDLVGDMARRQGIPKFVAMERAQRAYPGEYAAAYGA